MRLKLKNLSKKFYSIRGEIPAVDALDIEVLDREFFVILGPSGCGKSTILNLIAGLEKPTRGEIWFDDRLVACSEKRIFLTPKERNVAMVFQDYALYPHLSVFGNIAFPLRIARLDRKKVERAVRRTAARLEIEELLAAKPAELSGGQRQRVAIARAIVREPDVFLLDEPLSNLDARLRAQTRTELRLLQKSLGITTVYVTHDQVEALTLGDRVAVIDSGGVAQTGTPEELYERPGNAFVAGFIGSPPMNLIEAVLQYDGDRAYVAVGKLKLAVPPERKHTLEDIESGPCLLGIRPEDVTVLLESGEGSFETTIRAVESTGRDTIVHLSMSGRALSALAGSWDYREGEKVYIRLDMGRSHIFPPG